MCFVAEMKVKVCIENWRNAVEQKSVITNDILIVNFDVFSQNIIATNSTLLYITTVAKIIIIILTIKYKEVLLK